MHEMKLSRKKDEGSQAKTEEASEKRGTFVSSCTRVLPRDGLMDKKSCSERFCPPRILALDWRETNQPCRRSRRNIFSVRRPSKYTYTCIYT
jgi:hypothetical protein